MAVIRRQVSASRGVIIALLVFVSMGALHAWGANLSSPVALIDEESLLIVEVTFENHVLIDGLFVYHQTNYTLLPLGELTQALQFPIEIDAERLVAEGWFIEESNTFNVDLKSGVAYIRGAPVPIADSANIISDGFDVYVDAKLVEQWFDLSLSLDFSRLRLALDSDATLPIIQQLARERNRSLKLRSSANQQDYPVVPDQYRRLGTPLVSGQLSYIDTNDINGLGYRLQGSGDFMHHESRYSFVKVSPQSEHNYRVSLHRKPVAPHLQMPLGFSEYSLGDIVSEGDALVRNGASGVGVRARRDLDNQFGQNFSERNIEGDAPPGWEVELYSNNLLVDFQRVGSNGRYLFAAVPVQFGENIFDMKIYGPQGQIRTRRERIRVGDTMVKPNEVTYDVSVVREADQLISSGGDTIDQSNALSVDAGFGLTEHYSLAVGAARITPGINQAARNYQTLALQAAWPFAATQFEVARENSGGHASNFTLFSRIFKYDLRLQVSQYSGFISDKTLNGQLQRDTELRWAGYRQVWGTAFNYNWLVHEVKRRLTTEYQVETRWGLSIQSFRLSNRLKTRKTEGQAGRFSDGTFNIDYFQHKHQVRASLDYQVKPNAKAQRLVTTYDLRRHRQYNLQLKSELGLARGIRDRWGISFAKQFQHYALSLDGERDDKDQYRIELSLSVGAALQSKFPYIRWLREYNARGGRLNAKVFLDEDNDRMFSAVDTPLEGIEFRGRSDWKGVTTNEAGEITLTQMNSTSGTLVEVHEPSLEDPFWKPYQAAQWVYSHEGADNDLWVPIMATTEIEGYVRFIRNDASKAGSGVKIILADHNGVVVARTTTEFDGFYFFSEVPPGEHWLGLDSKSFDRSRFLANAPILITTDAEEGLKYMTDILIVAN